MAIYPLAYAGGASLTRRARKTRNPLPTVNDAKRAARRETRRVLKRDRRSAARRTR